MRFPLAAERVKTCLATGVEPTKLMARTCGWSQSALTTSRPPLTRFTTPLGRPVFSKSSKARCMDRGTRSDGFRMKVFPHAMAYGRNQYETIAGRCAAPTCKGINSGLDSSIDVGGCREGRARQHLRSSGVGNVYVLGRGRSLPGAIHVVLEFGYLGGYGTAHTQLLGLDAE